MRDDRAAEAGSTTDPLGASPAGIITPLHARIRARSRPALEEVAPLPHPGWAERRHNLPAEVSSFLGRDRELGEVERLLATTRLLTLTGAPGVGKTRLALRVAALAVEEFTDGVWLVELAGLADPTLVPQAVASALGMREQPGRLLVDTLADALRPRRLLLMLDNCEHLVAACALLADGLLRACPDLVILATSREALGIAGETAWRVPSLTLPTMDDGRSTIDDPESGSHRPSSVVHRLLESEAVRLLVERARAAEPAFDLTEGNVAAVVQVCRRLDGIPLALELAAARVKVLTVEQIAERLDDRFWLLTAGSRTALPRQQTLRAAVDWSYALLPEAERALLRRLAVFAGGWTLEAAEAVATDYSVLDLLQHLVEKSLVVAEARPDGTLRYRMLETLQQYALERLVESGEVDEARRRHAAGLLALAERAQGELRGPRETEWLARLGDEHDNLRAALRWAIDHGEAAVALRLGGALWRFWDARGHLGEGARWLEEALALDGDGDSAESELVRARAAALNGAGNLARNRGEYARSATLHEECLALRRRLDDPAEVARSLSNLGLVARDLGDYALARARFDESLALYRELGDTRGVAVALLNLGRLSHDEGDAERAVTLYEESLALSRALGSPRDVATTLHRLGDLARGRGDLGAAGTLHGEALELHQRRGDAWGIGISLTYLARVAAAARDHAQTMALAIQSLRALCDPGVSRDIAAALVVLADVACATGRAADGGRLLGAVARVYLDVPLTRTERVGYEQAVAAARAALGKEAFEAAWARGQLLTLERAVDEALATEELAPLAAEPAPPAPRAPSSVLSRREREVAALIARGLTNRQIANELVISEMTADTHVSHILRKLRFRSRAQVATWVTEQGLHAPSG